MSLLACLAQGASVLAQTSSPAEEMQPATVPAGQVAPAVQPGVVIQEEAPLLRRPEQAAASTNQPADAGSCNAGAVVADLQQTFQFALQL